MHPAPVRLNVYDMYWLNDYASTLGFGIFHSGVEIYGVEYAYGGHQFPFSGIFTNQPQDAEELGENFKFKESIYIGDTSLTKKAVEQLVKSLGDDFRGDRYHLITKNCNHFTADLAKELTGLEVPGWVNRLANVSNSIPFLEKWIPQEWLTPMALQETLESEKRQLQKPHTLNYPLEKAQEAVIECGSPNSRRRAGPAAPVSTALSWGFLRRGSETGGSAPASAPTSARAGSSSQPLSRLWNSIKSIASDDAPSSPTLARGKKATPVQID